MTIKETALRYLANGLSVLPMGENKVPLIPWKAHQEKALDKATAETVFKKSPAIGIVTGKVSGNLEVIDVDLKYDISGDLWDRLRATIQEELPELWEDFVIAQTKSGGYHIYYRSQEISGNMKLAQRGTTKEEKNNTYLKEIGGGVAKETAKKRAENDKVRVLLETRGEGGYVVAPPSPGYTYTQGDPKNIPHIAAIDRDKLFSICQRFDTYEKSIEPPKKPKKTTQPQSSVASDINPFEDYKNRGDIVALLEGEGWKEVKRDSERIYFLRPGESSAEYSGNYHIKTRNFKVWSSSTEFEEQSKGYSPADVFTILKAGGDTSKAAALLWEAGYGKDLPEFEPPIQVSKEQKKEIVNRVNKVTMINKVITVTEATTGEILLLSELSPGSKITIAEDTVENVISAIKEANKKGITLYIQEPTGEPIRDYRYRLQNLFKVYGEIEQAQGGLSDSLIDSLLEEAVGISGSLDPIDKDRYIQELLNQPGIQEIGITQESLSLTVKKIAATEAKERQREAIGKLLTKAEDIFQKGDPKGSLDYVEKELSRAKRIDKEEGFKGLRRSVDRAEMSLRLKNKPESLDSGYIIGSEKLYLPSGALSVFAAPTSHGKTTMLLNLLLNVAERNPKKEFYLFSYEEDADAVFIKALNCYQGETLSKNNVRTIESFYKGDSNYFERGSLETFKKAEDTFFSELIDTNRINIIYYSKDSDTLNQAVRYLSERPETGGIFIDYFQLLNLPEERAGSYASRQPELKEICINLKDTAVDTGLPIILGAQFNREVTDPRKIHSTRIGEAGDIERIANTIVGFWNSAFSPSFDKTGSKLTSVREEFSKYGLTIGVPGHLYVEVLKNRGGVVGNKGSLFFDGNRGKITNTQATKETEETGEPW